MHPGAYGARMQAAQERLVQAAETLADRFGIAGASEQLAGARHRDVRLGALYQLEAAASVLDAVAAATGPAAEIPDASLRLAAMTVDEITAEVADADAETLDRLEAAEQAGKQRRGVFAALHARRDALAAEAEQPAEDQDDGQAVATEAESEG